MTDAQRTTRPVRSATIVVAGVILAGGALAAAGEAAADPMVPVPPPGPVDVAAAPPGQPVADAPGAPVAPPAPPPVGPPTVPEIANPVYGSGSSGSGPIGSLVDIWHQVRDGNPAPPPGTSLAPPPGAGPPPPLPPGYTSFTAPESSTPAKAADPNAGPEAQGPPLPPGYHSLDGPPPPGYEYLPPTVPGAPAPPITP